MRLKHPKQPLAHRTHFCKTFLFQNTFLNITSMLKISCTFQIQLQQVLGGFQTTQHTGSVCSGRRESST